MRIAVTAALLAALSAGPALAQQSAPAKSKPGPQAAQPHTPAKPSLAQLAAGGDAQAQYQLGLAHLSGKGAKKSAAEAASWFAIAAGNGVKEAAAELAKLYETGSGLRKDVALAAQWWYRAGTLGDEAARGRFLTLFLAGQTRSLGGAAGAQWLQKLAEDGDDKAVLALGEAYEKGLGIPTDEAQARKWYQEAAYAGSAEAKFRLGRMLLAEPAAWRLLYKDREREKDNKDRDRLYATRAAAETAGGGDREPDLVRPGMVEAEAWLLEAARAEHAEAQYLLGKSYLGGMDLPFDLIHGLQYLSAAAWNGHGPAMMVLAELAAKGQGFHGQDPVRAWVNYDMAADRGYRPAEDARDRLAKAMNPRQLARARQVAQDIKGN